jgi:hypothetical protein
VPERALSWAVASGRRPGFRDCHRLLESSSPEDLLRKGEHERCAKRQRTNAPLL